MSALAEGYLCGVEEGDYVHIHTYIYTYTHAHMHTCTHAHMHTCTHAHMHTGLSPEFYDSIIRLLIPISSGVLMMIGVLPEHPSPHVSFVRWWLVDGIGGWVV